MKKNSIRIAIILLLTITNAYAGIEDTIDKVFDFLDDGIVQSVAVLLMVGVGATLASGRADKFKTEMYCVLFGVGIIYSAKEIAEAIF